MVATTPGSSPRRLTRGAHEAGISRGLAEYIAQEEMDRQHGFWWSRSGHAIAYTEVDERHIVPYRIEHQGRETQSYEEHRYPFAGHANAIVRLGVVRTEGGPTTWLDLGATGLPPATAPGDLYLARVHWLASGDLLVEVQDREQRRLDLVHYSLPSGKARLVARETSDVWINLHSIFVPLHEVTDPQLQRGFVWATERSGFRHLVLFDSDHREVRTLTEGPWLVDRVVGLDAERGRLFFLATRDGATERHLYVVSLAGGPAERLTAAAGMHDVTMDDDAKRYVDTYSALDTPPRATLHDAADGKLLGELPLGRDPRIDELGLAPPELVELANRDGVTLHGAVYKPPGEGPFPTIVSVYGGPHAQRVQNDWSLTADMRAQYLRSLGFLVFKLDNRGAARRGLAFEGAIRHDLGNVEVRDQVDGVHWLVERGLCDPKRVGIYGWSYGGYIAAMALAQAPEVFRVAVSGAPVTHWDGYDTHYTERYMGTPASNPEGYTRSSVMHHVEGIAGKLLLVHGMIDENVHFRHTARLVQALIQADKDYRLLVFPDERHMPRSLADRVYMEARVRDFFLENL